MARIPRNAVGNMVYHVINRANGREQIFHKEKDCEAFEKTLFEAKEKYPIHILPYCIMPNHWHFVLYPENGEDLSQFSKRSGGRRYLSDDSNGDQQLLHKDGGITVRFGCILFPVAVPISF